MRLRQALEVLLDGWRSDVSADWRDLLAGVEPDFAGVAANLELDAGETIFPGRKGAAPAGARADSHIFRALDGVRPQDVSVVVMGQDPYTKVAQATGRSFEQGDLSDWFGTPRVAPSLKRMIQALATSRTGDERYLAGAGGWQRILDDIHASRLSIPAPLPLWDHWQSQGVLYLNAILTFNRVDPAFQFNGHGRLWSPILRTILGKLVERPDQPIVFVAWGGKAKEAFDASGAEQAARDAGTWEESVTLVRRAHPNSPPFSTPPFLAGENAFSQINAALQAVGGTAIDW